MNNWRKITVEKSLHYLFLLASIGAGLLTLLNLSAYLGLGSSDACIRSWVYYGLRTLEPTTIPIENGRIMIHDMGHIQFAVVHFDRFISMLQGIPLLCLLCLVLSDLAILVIFYQMMRIFRSLDKGEVFRSDNMRRMRSIAYAILTYAILTFLNSTFMAHYIQGFEQTFHGAVPAIRFERVLEGLLVAFIILALQKAFKLGVQLQHEQDLTI